MRSGFDAFCAVMSALAGAFMLWLGGTALIVAALCWFMAGGFFQRSIRHPSGEQSS